jgi:hypothetical protein
MAYLDAVDGALRKRLSSNATINSLVSTRIYPSYLASLVNPQYPLICFSRLPVARDFRYNKRVTCQYSVWIYSTKSFAQTDQIFEAVKDSLDNEFFDLPDSLGRVGFKIIEYPSQESEPGELLYYAMFTIQAIAFFK